MKVKEVEDQMLEILGEISITTGDHFYPKDLETEALTVARNFVLESFINKESMKKADLKKQVQKSLDTYKI